MISKANVKNIYPLTPLQEGILFHDLYDSGTSYFEQFSYRIVGLFDIQLFQNAWDKLVQRHDVLRTIFVHKDVPRPLQIVLKQWRIDFKLLDLKNCDDAETRILFLKEEDRNTPFNLTKDPLTRVTVVQLSDKEAEVIWSHHHIILDGWSAGILQGELLEIYTALVAGKKHLLPEPVPFSSYVTWIGKQNQEASRLFWRKSLESFSQATGIPKLTPVSTLSTRETHKLRLSALCSEALTILSSKKSVTLNVLLQTLWGVLLCRNNGVENAVFAATVSGRPDDLKGIEGMVGIFINAVPVRISLDGVHTFSELLQRVQTETLAASRHHWCSLADIQAETSLKQGLLDHILIFENYPLDERAASQEGVGSRSFEITNTEMRENTNYPFELSIIPGEEIEFKFGFDSAIYTHHQIERIGWSLEHLIESVISSPDIEIDKLSTLSERERDEILNVFNKPEGLEATETVGDVLEQQVLNHPDKTALIFESTTLSYRELNSAANRVANYLQNRCSVQPDQVIGILMDRSDRMMAALLGVIKSGATYLPLDPAFPSARIAYMLQDSCCKVLLTEQKHLGELTNIPADATIIELDQLPDAPTTNPSRTTKPEHLLYLIYTSGSTGLPKGVMLEHRNIISFNRNMSTVYGVSTGDTILALTTITFDISVLELICSLMSGMTILLASDTIANNPGKAAELVKSNSVNVLQITPSRMKLMLEETPISTLSGLKALLIGGEPLPEYLFEKLKELPDTELFNVYGPTEATIWSTTAHLNSARLTIGTPLIDEDVLIISPTGAILPAGVWGELCIGGQGLARGYWNRPELTSKNFTNHPVKEGGRIYHTGDLGRFLTDGTIQCGGRMDNQVKVRGYRIETGEIEQNLLKIKGVKEAVAHVVEIDGLNEIAAYLVPDTENSPPQPSEIRTLLSQALPDYMLPTYYIALEKVPLTPNGKTDRKALPLPDIATKENHKKSSTFISPRTELESLLANIWQRILNVEQVGIYDNFFELGGHSIKAIRTVSAIAKELGKDVALPLLFNHPTIAGLSTIIENGDNSKLHLKPLEQQDWYATSPGQRRIWILQKMMPDSSAYNMPVLLKLNGDINTQALQAACFSIVKQHESLRTLFPEKDGVPVQLILPSIDKIFKQIDCTTAINPDETAIQTASREAATAFDLATDPLFTVTFYQTAKDSGLLLLLMHHIIGDAWSWRVLLHQFSELYHAFCDKRTLQLTPLSIQYKEWAYYQNRALASDQWKDMRQYWLDSFIDPPAPLELPLDFPRPQLRGDNGASVSITLPAELVARLNECAKKDNATLFMVLLAILKILLYRMTNQTDIVVGIPVAGRPSEQLEQMIGFFINTLALRDKLNPEATFTQLLEQIRKRALEAYQHQLYPFDTLVSELALPRDTGRAPLFDVMAVLQERADTLPEFRNMSVTDVQLSIDKSRFDLTFNFNPAEDGSILLELEYATDIFLPETANRVANRFIALADSVTNCFDAKLNCLNLLPFQESSEISASAGGETVELAEDMTIIDLFLKQIEKYPDARAVSAAGSSITYRELDALSSHCAAALQRVHNLQKEEIVAVMTGRTTHLLVSLLGIMKAGGVYLPIDPDQPESRIKHILSDSSVRTVLTDSRTFEKVSSFSDTTTVLNVESMLHSAPFDTDLNHPVSSSAAYIIYTSGSTGLPKGAILEHGGFVNMIMDQIRTFGITPTDNCLLFSTFSFDGAMSEIFLALHSGATLVIADKEHTSDPAEFCKLLQKEDVTVATLPPVYLNALRSIKAPLETLKIIITAGEAAIPADAIHYSRNRRFFNAYGPTEASVCSAIHKIEHTQTYHGSIPIGKPMANSELLLLDELLQPVPFGVTAEISVAGPGLARKYLNNPELTAEKFVPHPFKNGKRLYKTGDLGRRLFDGTVEFLGRKDDQVKVRGYRIECGEIERVLLKYPDISGAVVVARGEGSLRELVAFMIQDNELDERNLKSYLASRIPSYMIPARFITLEIFPQNVHGKIDRKALITAELSSWTAVENGEPPVTEMEIKLAAIWCTILERTEVVRNDSFFEIGGQSIAAIKLAGAIKERLGINIPLPIIFSYPTLQDMALQCEQNQAFRTSFEDKAYLQLTKGGANNIFAFPPITGYSIAYTPLAEKISDVNLYGFNFLEDENRLQHYIETINQIQPNGALILLGYSSGGNLAFEAAKLLELQGRTVSDIILLDSWKRLVVTDINFNIDEWAADYAPDPELYGNLGELITNPHIMEIAFGKMRRYISLIESIITSGAVNAVIHLLKAEDDSKAEGLSQEWSVHTTEAVIEYQADGTHLSMLHNPSAALNAAIIDKIVNHKKANPT